jgi:dTDP-4-amino-4,6-dideoxygalactose transaminase
LAARILALPIHPDLGEADVGRVCDAVRAALG